MRLRIHNRAFGFTLIELLIVISVTTIIGATGLIAYRSYTRRQVVTQAAEQVRTDLNSARQRAISGENPGGGTCSGSLMGYLFTCGAASYSVKAVYSSGCTVQVGNTVNLPTDVTFSSCQGFTFNALGEGTTLALGGQTIKLANSQGSSVSFSVSQSGVVGNL